MKRNVRHVILFQPVLNFYKLSFEDFGGCSIVETFARHDIKGGLDLFHRWLGAGFYYKMFKWPDWHLFEPSIRKMAGLSGPDMDPPEGFTSDQVHAQYDLRVAGGGAARLASPGNIRQLQHHAALARTRQLGPPVDRLPA